MYAYISSNMTRCTAEHAETARTIVAWTSWLMIIIVLTAVGGYLCGGALRIFLGILVLVGSFFESQLMSLAYQTMATACGAYYANKGTQWCLALWTLMILHSLSHLVLVSCRQQQMTERHLRRIWKLPVVLPAP